jgi:tetratricopeptide (TPR) repeat protein
MTEKLKESGVPTSPSSTLQQARSLCEQGRWSEVLAFAQRWQRQTPDAAKAFFYEGVGLVGLGQFIAAETAYYRALALDDQDFKIWNNLAALLFDALGQPVEGAKCLAQAMQLDPGNKLGWANLASMYGQIGRHVQALECADRALALDPEMVEAQLHRARAAQALGKPEIVRAASEALSRLPPEKFHRAR